MNTIYENITKLCEEHGITGAKMCRDIGVGKSLLSSLKSGRTKSINAQTAVKIADYFSVPVDAITVGNTDRISTAEEIEKAAPVSESGFGAANNWLKEADIKKILSQMTPNELAELMGKVALELKGRGLE